MPDPVAGSLSILLVDDNPHGLTARKRLLLDLGYQVETALSAEEALRRIDSDQQYFHLIVTDFRMIGMDGVELIARVKLLSPSTKTVLLSGFVEALGMTEETTGADAVISKSAVEVNQLTRTVKLLLARRVVRKPVASITRVALTFIQKTV